MCRKGRKPTKYYDLGFYSLDLYILLRHVHIVCIDKLC